MKNKTKKNKIQVEEKEVKIENNIEKKELDKKEYEEKDLQKLIEKNIKWSQVIYNQNKKIKHRMTMMIIGNYLRLLLLIIPIVLGIIYLPDFIASYLERYSTIFNLESQDNLNILLNSLK